MMHVAARQTSIRNKLTFREFTCYRLASRNQIFNPALHSGKLTQQLIVDLYCRYEGMRLDYIRFNQKELRVESYAGLHDTLNSHAQTESLLTGKVVILPSTFSGSPRNMMQRYQNEMAVVRSVGKPDYFITLTCNPKWSEITQSIRSFDKVSYRPEIVARVFAGKVDEL